MLKGHLKSEERHKAEDIFVVLQAAYPSLFRLTMTWSTMPLSAVRHRTELSSKVRSWGCQSSRVECSVLSVELLGAHIIPLVARLDVGKQSMASQ